MQCVFERSNDLRTVFHQRPFLRTQMTKRRIEFYERNFKNFLSLAIMDIKLPMAGPQFPAVHQFQHDIAGIAIGHLGIGKLTPMSSSTPLPSSLSLNVYFGMPALQACCKDIKIGTRWSARNVT